MYFLLQ